MAENRVATTPETNGALTPVEKRHFVSLEKRIERGMGVFREVGEALMDIRDHRLYRETHPTFDAYCRDRWQFDRGRAYQLIGAAEVARSLPKEFPPIANEAQARELVALVRENPSAVADVWREVTSKDEPPSASRIREVVRQHIKQPEPAPEVPPAVKLVAAIDRATGLAKTWVETRPGRSDRQLVRDALARLTSAVG